MRCTLEANFRLIEPHSENLFLVKERLKSKLYADDSDSAAKRRGREEKDEVKAH